MLWGTEKWCLLNTDALKVPTNLPYETLNSIHHFEDIYEKSENLSKVTLRLVYGIMVHLKFHCPKKCNIFRGLWPVPDTVYAIYFAGVLFSRVGCYSRIQQHAKINLPPIPTHECDLCIRNSCSTVHMQMSFSDLRPWLLSSSIANLTTRGNVLKSWFAKN